MKRFKSKLTIIGVEVMADQSENTSTHFPHYVFNDKNGKLYGIDAALVAWRVPGASASEAPKDDLTIDRVLRYAETIFESELPA